MLMTLPKPLDALPRSLRSKLREMDMDLPSADHNNSSSSRGRSRRGSSSTAELEKAFAIVAGTTFPPRHNQLAHVAMIRSKHCSEPDLLFLRPKTPASDLAKKSFTVSSMTASGLPAASSLSDDDESSDAVSDEDEEDCDHVDDDVADCRLDVGRGQQEGDLFFDFEIGSSDSNEEDAEQSNLPLRESSSAIASDSNRKDAAKTEEASRAEHSAEEAKSVSIPDVRVSAAPTVPMPASDSLRIGVGASQVTVASSKLNALIAMLEKDRAYAGGNKDQRKSCLKERSSSSAVLEAQKVPDVLHTVPSSPADFHYLAPEKHNAAAHTLHAAKVESSSIGRCKSTLLRSDSMPSLSAAERALATSPSKAETVPSAAAEDDDDEEMPKAKAKSGAYRRATSLKSGRSPPGTPGRRKIVRFADVFGLDLTDVRTFLDEVPRVPRSAYFDLTEADLSDLDSSSDSDQDQDSDEDSVSSATSAAANSGPAVTLMPVFSQPGAAPNFFDVVKNKKVCLESAFSCGLSVRGTVRVCNVSFEKKVSVRYSTDEWRSFGEVDAEYVQGSCDGFSDRFTFSLSCSLPLVNPGQRLQFCVRFTVPSGEFWDSGPDGHNYVFQCVSSPGHESSPSRGFSSRRKRVDSTNLNRRQASAASSSSSSAVSVPSSATASRSLFSQQHSSFSHSPSALAEEPWLRYL